jgi:thymidylate synthase (FAD)
MKIIDPSFQIVDYNNVLKTIELGARTCYKSEDRIGPGSDVKLIEHVKSRHHESVLEHGIITVKLTTDRGVLAEISRHRLISLSVESTRYNLYSKDKYGNEITVINPFFYKGRIEEYDKWENSCRVAELTYLDLIENGIKAEEARSVLPNSLKTEMQITANCREWRHIFGLRTNKASHPQMRQIMIPIANEFASRYPCLFGEYVVPVQDPFYIESGCDLVAQTLNFNTIRI